MLEWITRWIRLMPFSKRGILNIGAGNRILGNATNHDLYKHRPEIDVAWDLNDLPWPWDDESFGHISAIAVLEHLDIDLLTAINECWRILMPDGQLEIKLPYWNHEMAYCDPTHRYVVGLQIFDCFDPDTERGTHYSFYTDRKWHIERVVLNKEKSAVWGWLKKIGDGKSREQRDQEEQASDNSSRSEDGGDIPIDSPEQSS